MKLTILVPCFNECSTINEILSRVEACSYQPKEIIVVDDCSTDGTRDILRKRPARYSEQIIFYEKNQGKGAALRAGIAAATGDIIMGLRGIEWTNLRTKARESCAFLSDFGFRCGLRFGIRDG